MKKGVLVGAVGAAIVLAAVYGLRVAHNPPSATVTALLPKETVALFHLPDFNGTRDEWQKSDIYQLYREPDVQAFLKRPLSRAPGRDTVSSTFADLANLANLDVKDGFVAVTAIGESAHDANVIAGFRFRGSQDDAEKIIGRWRSRMASGSNRETVDYQGHKIQVASFGVSSVASVYDGEWFLTANNLDELKAVLDRVDGRNKDANAVLSADETFRGAMAKMPRSYVALLYLQPKALAEKLSALSAAQPAQFGPVVSKLQQVRCICAATRFDGGKMHDVLFAQMPKLQTETELTRHSLVLGTKDTFFFADALLNLSDQVGALDPATNSNALGSGLLKVARALKASGLTPDQWKSIFGSEVGVLADWPQDVHWPNALISFPVKDPARARQVASVLARNLDDDGAWVETDKDGVHYISMSYGMPLLLAVQPTIAVSDKMMIAGLDLAVVEAAMQRSNSGASALSDTASYKRVARALPEPSSFFGYADLGLLYARLDSTLGPMLMMGAAFIPWVNEYVDVSKLPSIEAVTKHLGPIVSSTHYESDGYVAESVGPITLNQAGLGAVVVAVGFGAWRDQQLSPGAPPFGIPSVGGARGRTVPAMPTPNPTP